MPAQSPLAEKRSRSTNGGQSKDDIRPTKPTRIQLEPIRPEKSKSKSRTSRSPREKEHRDLKKLLALLSTDPQYGQDQDQDGCKPAKTPQWPAPHSGRLLKHESTETLAFDQFSVQYQKERCFSKHPDSKIFSAIFNAIIKQRLENRPWVEHAPPQNILKVLQCLRILMRDVANQNEFISKGGVCCLAEHLRRATDSYLMFGDTAFVVDILTQLTNMFQKLSAREQHRSLLVRLGVHESLVLLLSASDVVVLHCTLHALICLAQSPEPRTSIAELNSIEIVLRIIQDYDIMSKKLAANLLRLLCADSQAREMIKVYDGIPILLSVLQNDGVKLLVYVVWCLVQLSEDREASEEIRQRGGISLLLSLLGDRKLVSDRTAASGQSVNIKSPGVLEEDPLIFQTNSREALNSIKCSTGQMEEVKDNQVNLKSACCACLTELVLNDTNAQQIVQSNGIYTIAQLILTSQTSDKDGRATYNLQANAFRTLRFLFSMERNRKLFMRIFPPEMFEKFIDIGHYNRELQAYSCVVDDINRCKSSILEQIRDNLELTNQNRESTRTINDYAVLELLGSGGYGNVYKVKKHGGQTYQAMKEINTMSAMWGTSMKERQKSVGDVVSEITIIKEQLKHPNVVRYYKTFIENDRLHIVMELIEGAPIGEHFQSLKEKKEKFSEDRIWHIFIQLVLALRYLHKEKKIVHRDLTPNNIMLGEGDKVTITDFGLAKVKQADCSKMLSQVGTIYYSCPEVIQHKPYSEKADIWAIGCILYQMCTLSAPFSTNLLSLALKIVNADYDPIPDGQYSEKVISTVRLCITADPDKRPDIVGVASHLAEIILQHVDGVKVSKVQLEKKLEHERRKTRQHFSETHRSMQHFHQLYQVTQERYDKLANLASSGGASSMKDETEGRSVCDNGLEVKGQCVGSPPSDRENGWTTDDDQYSSGSECPSRESSAGLPGVLGRGGPTGPLGRPHALDRLTQQLTLEIPQTKYSLDSGNSSGDPSPNNSSPPSVSIATTPGVESSSIEGLRRPRSYHSSTNSLNSPTLDGMGRIGIRARPSSATTLTISQKKVREITDPVLQMLHQLHKIIYITQLPPTLTSHRRRGVIERYKRALFSPATTASNLKNELRKLLTGSKEVIDLNFGPLDNQPTSRQQSQESDRKKSSNSVESEGLTCDLDASSDIGVTYEQMQSIIEMVLVESGYYNVSSPVNPTSELGAPLVRSLSTPYGKST